MEALNSTADIIAASRRSVSNLVSLNISREDAHQRMKFRTEKAASIPMTWLSKEARNGTTGRSNLKYAEPIVAFVASPSN
jgi:hypothetical protein